MAAHRSPEERRALVAEWLESPLSTSDFAHARDVSASSLHRWRRQLDDDDSELAGFVELVPASSPSRIDVPAPIEIQVGGAAVLVRDGVDLATLATVLAALRSAS